MSKVSLLFISLFLLFSGVWATRVIPKGKKLGPFVGEKKKRSQVTSNIYMWEVCCSPPLAPFP